jgi:hypothetical protein
MIWDPENNHDALDSRLRGNDDGLDPPKADFLSICD